MGRTKTFDRRSSVCAADHAEEDVNSRKKEAAGDGDTSAILASTLVLSECVGRYGCRRVTTQLACLDHAGNFVYNGSGTYHAHNSSRQNPYCEAISGVITHRSRRCSTAARASMAGPLLTRPARCLSRWRGRSLFEIVLATFVFGLGWGCGKISTHLL